MISKNQIKRIKQLELKKYRRREGLFVAEGPKVVGDLLRAGHRPEEIYISDDAIEKNNLAGLLSQASCPVERILPEELHKISFLQHPQQVLALFHMPTQTQPQAPQGLTLALDGVQDPGNLGTIIRIADWFNIPTIYCSEETADAWNPKVIQATMGSISRVNIIYTDLAAIIEKTTLPVYGTLLEGEDIYSQPLTPEGIIVMGNEGNGISPKIRSLISHKLLIPNFRQGEDAAESLNVAIATAITCSEFRRRTI